MDRTNLLISDSSNSGMRKREDGMSQVEVEELLGCHKNWAFSWRDRLAGPVSGNGTVACRRQREQLGSDDCETERCWEAW